MCAGPSLFVHVTVVPDETFNGFGVKQLFATTQSAVALEPEPVVMLISTESAFEAFTGTSVTVRLSILNPAFASFDAISEK